MRTTTNPAEQTLAAACAVGLDGHPKARARAIAEAAARTFASAQREHGLVHPGRGRKDAHSIAAAVPARTPNRTALLAACASHGIDAEQAAFAAACSITNSEGGAMWYFALLCNGMRPEEIEVGERLIVFEAMYPTLYSAYRGPTRPL